MRITRLLLCLALAPAGAFALDWTRDPLTQLRPLMEVLPAAATPVAVPLEEIAPLECRPEIIAAFKAAWSKGGSGFADYEAAFRVDPGEGAYMIEYMPMTYEPLKLPVRYDPGKTVAIVHTHPDSAEPTPGPGDYASKVPNYVVSRLALYVTIPGTKRHRFVRRDWRKPCV